LNDVPIRILVIDDDEVDRRRIRRFINEKSGYQQIILEERTDAKSGLEALKSQVYDCVLLDFNLPDADGLSIIRTLNTGDGAIPPIIMQTVLDDDEIGLQTVAAGAQDYLIKGSFDSSLLMRSIRYACERHKLVQEKAILLSEYEKLAIIDGLTGAYNRMHFENELNHRVSEGQRNNYPFSLMLLDVDHFKTINDIYGHQGGDTVLKAVASALKSRLRTSDILARYGGDEFVIILPGAELPTAIHLANQLLKVIADVSVPSIEPTKFEITISIGVAQFPADGDANKSLVACVDRRLYAAKTDGRNRLVYTE